MNKPVELEATRDKGADGEFDLGELLVGDEQANERAEPARKPRRTWRWVVVLLLLSLGGASGYYLWRGGNAQPRAFYKTAVLAHGDVVQSVTASGAISPIKTVTVGSQVSGQITALMVDYNSPVTNGQLIAQLDPSTYEQLLVQAEADLANANAALSLAKLTYQRAKQLDEQKAKPHYEFEKAEVELQQAEATAKSRGAALKKVQVDLERTTIYSPIDGIVISRAVDVGQTVAANFNAPTLFTIAKDLKEMRIQAAVSEADIGGVREGEAVRFTVDAFPNLTFNGEVTQVRFEPSTNQNVVTYASIVNVRNDDLKLRPGMTANATIITSERKNVLRVPNAALRFTPAASALASVAENKRPEPKTAQPLPGGEGASMPAGNPLQAASGSGGRTIYLVEGGAVGMTLKPVMIHTGVTDGTWTEILEGIKEGDVVATGTATAASQASAASKATSNPFSMRGGPPPR
jgi:HlyD family secretion protein